MQLPALQVSVCVQASPSLQLAPSAFGGFEQVPVPGSHVPAVWHWSLAVQTTGFELVHAPDWQVSVCVHPFASSQLDPFGLAGFVQAPVAGLHVPASWHGSLAVEVTGFDPVQVPAWQVSVCVQTLPSSQAVPVSGAWTTPVCGPQESAVQASPSSRFGGVPA